MPSPNDADAFESGPLSRGDPFGHACGRCGLCCRKSIRVDPYEVARLAQRVGVRTTEILEKFTVQSPALTLRRRDDGACIFWEASGCSVYSDRPLACRIYPLAYDLNAQGEETFFKMRLVEGTAGHYTSDSAIEAYLERNDVGPYIDALRKYLAFYAAQADADLDADAATAERADDHADEASTTVDESADLASELTTFMLDMDAAIAKYVQIKHRAEPQDLCDRIDLHIEGLYFFIAAS